ncbi:NAD(P)H-dependent oxidoreductase [Vibrio sp. 404]|uniref:NAD(P)H-dependent oxidoreductase n=1 Tax=Vibrio marinisediminis TaxID=2758441 RepID=A0A7W2FMY0_9VIBR|nr:NAD(P)H-dependent oxidoreductase [Vibrio marinisediminis]MBA5760917.1 NAD(P)H-dependent oxidoreductase [Vibrio marinisediminis]
MPKNKVLVLYAHPSQHRSEVNQSLFHAAENIEGVTTVDLYYEYPSYNINIDREQKRLVDHDVIIFQFPLYWYSTPAMLKEWQDLVLEYGFAYGSQGIALKGKRFMCALSAGGRADAYQTKGYNHFTIRELLYPIEQMAALTGMLYMAPLALFGARTAKEEGRVAQHTKQWQKLLTALVNDQFDYKRAYEVEKINPYLNQLILGEKE